MEKDNIKRKAATKKGDLKIYIRNIRTKRYEKDTIQGAATSLLQNKNGQKSRS